MASPFNLGITIQSGGCTIPQNGVLSGMADRSQILSPPRTQMGTTHGGSVCSPVTTKFHSLSWKTGPASDGDQRYDDELSQTKARAPLSTLEPAAINPSQESTLTSVVTLVTPWWPSVNWFPTLQRLAQPRPLQIPRLMVLPPPGHSQSVLCNNLHWSLSAWRVNYDV